MQAEKGGYKHFMLKEIHEQPRAIEDTLRGRIDLASGRRHRRRDRRRRRSSRKSIGASTSSPAARATTPRWPAATGSSSSPRVPAVVELGQRGSLPRARLLPGRSRRRREPVRRDGSTRSPPSRRPRRRAPRSSPRQRARQRHPARGRRRALHARRARDWRRLDQVLHDAARRAAAARGLPRPPPRHALDGDAPARCSQALVEVPSQMRDVLGASDDVHGDRARSYHARARHALPRPRPRLPHRARGRAQAQGDLYIHAEGYAAGEMKHGPIALIDENMPVVVVVPARLALREDALERAGGARARGPGHRRRHRGRRRDRWSSPQHVVWIPKVARVRAAAPHRAAAPALRVLRRRPEGHRRRPAAQPRQDGHRRVDRYASDE